MRKIKQWKALLGILAFVVAINIIPFPDSYANETGALQEKEIEGIPGEDAGEQPGEDSGEMPGEEPEDPSKPKIEQYELRMPKEDGEQGYYVTKPELQIRHVSEYGMTKYQLYHEKELVREGKLTEKGTEIRLEQEEFEEGNYWLKVWMEDLDGEKIEETACEKEWKIDTIAPEISLNLPRGFDTWYQQETVLTIQSSDSGSKVKQILCTSGEQKLGEFQEAQGSVKIQIPSTGGQGTEVQVYVWDHAGNCAGKTVRIPIDGSAPRVQIEGAENYMITSKPVKLSLTATEENTLKNVQADIWWEHVDGKRKRIKVQNWKTTGEKAQAKQVLEKDGLYEITLKAEDQAGYRTEKKI